MKLHEFQAKRIFAQYGVPIPRGEVATTATQAREIAQRLGKPAVIKSQVLVGGRGKAGGIKLARTPDDAEAVADKILGMSIKGMTVKRVLVDEASDIQKEIYLGMVIDRARRRVVMMASSEGGIDIEEVAATKPDAIKTVLIDPALGMRAYQAIGLASGIGLSQDLFRAFTKIAIGLNQAFTTYDAQQAEIIKYAQLDGSMSLVLRSADDFRDPVTGEPLDPTLIVPAQTTGVTLRVLVDTNGILVPELVEAILPAQSPAP